jgi:hypothetical protein
VLPVAPGGGSDIIVRIVTQKVAVSIGQQFVIDYRGGVNGITTCIQIRRARRYSPPDASHDLWRRPIAITIRCGKWRSRPLMCGSPFN